jgi:hypothetical protein
MGAGKKRFPRNVGNALDLELITRPTHNCSMNYDGSSKGMEATALEMVKTVRKRNCPSVRTKKWCLTTTPVRERY